MAKLRTYTQEDLARSYAPLSSTGVGAKGSQSNPYTESEMNEMIDNGTWTGGFVVGLGYVAAEHTVTHPSSGSTSDWHCPECGMPYPTDGSMKCSSCGTMLSYGSGSSSSSGGGGGGGTSEEDPFENEGDITPEMLTNAAEEAVEYVKRVYKGEAAACNVGVEYMFRRFPARMN